MAHELGHAVFHMKEDCCFIKNYTLFLTSRLELQANMFAAELIIPDDILEKFTYFPVQNIAEHTGLSTELVQYRLQGLQLSAI